ncbi:MAG: IS4 family transposase [Dehalococcoidia bacterium]|nr:MAG: IS4 family transposase [Dehalococcoidia bacterium]
MPRTLEPWKREAPSFRKLVDPLRKILKGITPLASGGNRPLKMTFEDQLNALIYFHLEDHTSGRHLIQALKEDDFAREKIAPVGGIEKSSFFEAVNSRGLEQLVHVFEALEKEARGILPKEHAGLGDLISVDGSLINATLSMVWADYRNGAKKAKAHLGFNINQGIPAKIFLTHGKSDEKPFVEKIVSKGQTAVIDRYYQYHKNFDDWQEEGIHFVCRIRKNTTKEVIRENAISSGSIVFYDAIAYLGTKGLTRAEKEVRVVGYRVDGKEYWVATDRYDLTGEEIALIYKLRWNIEIFFGWWKRHLRVYHLIARTQYGVLVQILAGLITYLLLAIYCHSNYHEKVSIKRVRELRIKIRNEAAANGNHFRRSREAEYRDEDILYAKM